MTWWLGGVETLGPKKPGTYTFMFPLDITSVSYPFKGPMVVMVIPAGSGLDDVGILDIEVSDVVINFSMGPIGGVEGTAYIYHWTAKNLSDATVHFRFAHGIFGDEKFPSA